MGSLTVDGPKGVIFSNENSENPALFNNTDPGITLWSGVLLPNDSIYYKITDQSIHELLAANVPSTVTYKLQPLIGIVYSSQTDFDQAVQGVLTEQEYATYRTEIQTYSALNILNLTDVFANQAYLLFADKAPEPPELEAFIQKTK